MKGKLIVFEGKPAEKGSASQPMRMRDGMNLFLKEQGITMRREEQTKRPRINKQGSVLDEEQKKKGEYYYA